MFILQHRGKFFINTVCLITERKWSAHSDLTKGSVWFREAGEGERASDVTSFKQKLRYWKNNNTYYLNLWFKFWIKSTPCTWIQLDKVLQSSRNNITRTTNKTNNHRVGKSLFTATHDVINIQNTLQVHLTGAKAASDSSSYSTCWCNVLMQRVDRSGGCRLLRGVSSILSPLSDINGLSRTLETHQEVWTAPFYYCSTC